MYNKIIDPYSLKLVNINSIHGKNIIKQYLRTLLGGMHIMMTEDEDPDDQEYLKLGLSDKSMRYLI